MTHQTNLNEIINHEVVEMLQAKRAAAERKSLYLEACLSLGRELSALADEFPSTKLRGPVIKEHFPATAKMDDALITNSKWLYEALNKPGHKGGDILEVLEVISIFDLSSGNPTVIRRKYRETKSKLIQ